MDIMNELSIQYRKFEEDVVIPSLPKKSKKPERFTKYGYRILTKFEREFDKYYRDFKLWFKKQENSEIINCYRTNCRICMFATIIKDKMKYIADIYDNRYTDKPNKLEQKIFPDCYKAIAWIYDKLKQEEVKENERYETKPTWFSSTDSTRTN